MKYETGKATNLEKKIPSSITQFNNIVYTHIIYESEAFSTLLDISIVS